MTATIVITCPQCKNQLKAPSTIQGRKARCRRCTTIFTVPAGEGGAPPRNRSQNPPLAPARRAAASPAGSAADSTPYRFVEETAEAGLKPMDAPTPMPRAFSTSTPYGVNELKLEPRCPHCAKEMTEEAFVCIHCGYNSRTRTFTESKTVYETTGGDVFRWRLPAVLCVGLIVALLAFDWWFCFGLRSLWDTWDTNMSTPSFSRGARAGVAFMTAFAIWYSAKFAYGRLILNRRPPEIEKR